MPIRLRALTVAVESLELRTDRAATRAAAGYSTATDLADHLVRAGVPFRSAYEAVKELVTECVVSGTPLAALTIADLRRHHQAFGPEALDAATVERSIAARDIPGGTAPNQVQGAIAAAMQRLQAERSHWQSLPRVT